MLFFLSKFLPPLVYPLGFVSLLLFTQFWLKKRPHLQRALLWLACGLLWLASNRWVANGLVYSLERQRMPPAILPNADVIVTLGGGTNAADAPRPIPGLNEAGERMVYAAYLYKQGKAPEILVSGGTITLLGNTASEASAMNFFLEMMQIPKTAIIWEDQSLNTYENALYSKALLAPTGKMRILLVTSAIHMPRSVLIFEQQGFEVIPAPADFLITDADLDWSRRPLSGWALEFVPQVEYLRLTTVALREYIGLLTYRLLGRL